MRMLPLSYCQGGDEWALNKRHIEIGQTINMTF